MKQVIIGGVHITLDIALTEYECLCGGYSWFDQIDARGQVVSSAGTFRNLRIELDDVPGTGTYTFTLRRRVGLGAWANTVLTCTVAADGIMANDTEHDVAVAAGDVVVLECNPDNPDNARYARWTIEFEGDTANESLLLAKGRLDDIENYYSLVQGIGAGADETRIKQVCPTAGVIKNLYIQLKDDPGIYPDAYRFTFRVNGVNSDDGEGNPLQVTIEADDKTGNDTTHEISVKAGDILNLLGEPLNAPSAYGDFGFGMTFVADTDGESLVMCGEVNTDDTATEYTKLCGSSSSGWSATESQKYQVALECVFKKLYLALSGSPGAGKRYTYTVRRNETSPGNGLVVEIVYAATTGNDITHTIDISDGDEVGLMVVPTGTPTILHTYWGLVCYIEPPPPYKLEGFTKDKNGNVLTSCKCYLLKDNLDNTLTLIGYALSDAVTGAYRIDAPDSDGQYIVVAFKDNTPHVFDVTDHVLQPVEI